MINRSTQESQKKGGNMNENLTFPAISLCNFNSFNRRRYINLLKTRNMSSNDEIKLNLKFIESLLAKSSKDVFNSSSKKIIFTCLTEKFARMVRILVILRFLVIRSMKCYFQTRYLSLVISMVFPAAQATFHRL